MMQSLRRDHPAPALGRARSQAAARARRLSRLWTALDALWHELGRIREYHDEAERQAQALRRRVRRDD
jgi:uncharacterized membrane protein